MATNTPFYLSKQSQDGLLQYHRSCVDLMNRQWNFRSRMEEIDRAYIREQDWTAAHLRAVAANRSGGADKIQNVAVPVVKPQVTSAIAYQAGVFLTQYPMFGVVSDAQYIDQAIAMQSVIEENAVRGAWSQELLLFFADGFKYNLSALEVTWDKIVTAAIETDVSYKLGAEGRPKEIIWEGNCLKRWNPYNIYFDNRVELTEVSSKGEFAGHTEIFSRTALKTFINTLSTKLLENIIPAFSSQNMSLTSVSGPGVQSFFVPSVNPDAFIDLIDAQDSSWSAWMGLDLPGNANSRIQYNSVYHVSTEYARIMPADFNIRAPSPNTPQVWKFIWVNHSVLIYAERQTNAHEKIPVLFGAPSESGLGYQEKSLASDALPFQQTATALMNATLASRRRAINDRIIYDPSRISEAHINNPNPSARIPVRPAAFGKNIAESVYAFPYRDDQAGTNMQEIQALVSFGNVLNGQNAARQGQFVKGNKTDGQWENVMNNATSKDQLTAMLYEAQVFTPLKDILRLNTLQYQGTTTIYSPSEKRTVPIDPVALRRAVFTFKVTDGLLPADKVIGKDAWKGALQAIASSPSIGQAYNLGPMFSYFMKTENVDIDDFEKSQGQIAYEQAMGQWNQMGQLAIQKGAPFNIPQPIPANYGYDPTMNDPSKRVPAQSTETQNGNS